MKDWVKGLGLLLTLFVVQFAMIYLVANAITVANFKEEAVERGHARYSQETGKWEWND